MFHFYRTRIRPPRIRTRRVRRKSPGRTDYAAHKKDARKIILERLAHFVAEYGRLDPAYIDLMKYRGVSIRNQRSRWGSCSTSKNLSFNYRLVRLSPELRDYVIVHELCHLVEMNHGPQFWALAERLVPNARALSYQVRRIPIT